MRYCRPVSRAQGLALLAVVVALAAPASALFCADRNCYELLGLQRNATTSDIRRAYRMLSVEKHPDKKPGDAAAAEEFRLIGNAYTALKDESKRAKYNDFLDNPGKYYDFLMANKKEYYAPKTNTIIAVALILGVATVIHWLNMNHSYKSTIERMRESPEFKREIARLVKTKAAPDAAAAEAMLDLEIVGLEEPKWQNLFIVRAAYAPQRLFQHLKWLALWQWNYKVCKKEYSMDDKEYLIKKNLDFSEREWERLSESAQKKMFDDKLWDPIEAGEYLRLQRIALNRSGKKKKQKPAPPDVGSD